MRKTIITPNRSTTFIPNWWAKAHLFLLTALLFSCEEDLNLLGFRGDDQRFKVYYAEIPVPSSVVLLDSVRSMNYLSTETTRLLVGSYSDPLMGEVQARGFTQLRASDITSFIPAGSVYDSAILQLRFDFYNYGADGPTDFSLSVHELTESLSLENLYFSKSTAAYNPTPIGTVSTYIDQALFDKELNDTDADSLIVAKIKLAPTFGQRLFDAINPEDENFTNFNLFKNHFKGLAIIPTLSSTVVGISNNQNSALTVYYHTGETVGLRTFLLTGVTFSNITSDRSGTELNGLTNYHEDYTSPLYRYVQSGVGIATKLDFSGFYDLIDTYPNVIINSAELSINNVSEPGELEYPALGVVMLDENNRFKKLKTTQDTTNYLAFKNKVLIGNLLSADALSVPYVTSDLTTLLGLTYSKDDARFLSYPTLFFQQLYALRENRYPYWALTAVNPTSTKTVNRAVFSKDNIKLKIYYTRPNTEN
ncbi:MAG: DUF4270 family protein [Cyclobacteriaceae bacterium]|nr:DUF4270 family protein [Cyclobacteriaceae bacterium]